MKRTRILIIGGGMAGVSLGSELAPDHEVIVLEAESTLAAHSTGRSAALFLPGYGPETVQDLTKRSEPEFHRLEDLPGSPRLLLPRGALLTAWDEVTAAGLEATLNAGKLSLLTGTQAQRLCPALRIDELLLAGLDESAHDIDVMALHAHYVSSIRRHGGSTVTRARVTTVRRTGEGWSVTTADGRGWSSDLLVNAAGAWADHVAALCNVSGHALTPRRRTVAIARSGAPVPPDWPVVADAGYAWYFKPDSGALLLSPGDETPVPAGDPRPDPLDVAMALERVNHVTTLGLRSVQTAWAGLRTFAPDGCPVVGPHPDDPGLFCFVGQGGYGIQMAPALARAGADLIRNGTLNQTLAAALDPRRSQPALIEH